MSGQSLDPLNMEICTNLNLQGSGEVIVGPFRPEDYCGWDNQTYSSPNRFNRSRDIEHHARPCYLEEQEAPSPLLDLGRIGRFQIVEILGEGRHATVYRGFDPLLKRYVALKIPRDCEGASFRAVERFLGEVRALAQLNHPRIVSIYEAGYDSNHRYIAMELIDGQGLAELLTRGPLSCDRGAGLIAELAEAVDHAHGLGIIHRDIKPANIRLDQQGLAYLMDFGITYRRDSCEIPAIPGAIHGTPAYLAPEQAQGPRPEDLAASDQYSLGVVMYEVLCGRPPFVGSPSSVLFRAIHEHPVSPRAINSEVPRALAMICQKAMAKRPDQRYPNCGALAIQLRTWLQAQGSSTNRHIWTRLHS
jgi:serine/threonine protein kinase